jgi:hypothetical protein
MCTLNATNIENLVSNLKMKPPNIKYRQWIKYNLIFLIEHITNADFFKKSK